MIEVTPTRTRFFKIHPSVTENDFASRICEAVALLKAGHDGELCYQTLATIWQEWKLHARGFHFQRMPQSVRSTLENWLNGRWNLRVTREPISPREMLELQARGERPIGYFFADPESYFAFMPSHTAVTFLLHDLEHAYHFYHDPDSHLSQRRFFGWLLKQADDLSEAFCENQILKDKLDYLMSDMNGHIIYLLKTLRGIVDLVPDKDLIWNSLISNFPHENRELLQLVNRNESDPRFQNVRFLFS